MLQSVTKLIESWSKPVNILKIFERVQYVHAYPSVPSL